MADPYTPETIDVKMAYCTSFDPGFAHKVMAHTVAEMTTGHAGDFDRWLAEHDREVRAQAWAAGFYAATDAAPADIWLPAWDEITNPWLTDATEEPT